MAQYMLAVKTYLQALEEANLHKLMKLFDKQDLFYSPLYGRMPAGDFYRQLFNDTHQSVLTLENILINEKERIAAALFVYHWKMKNGTNVEFEVVDFFYFNE
jgi:hypothetical protein